MYIRDSDKEAYKALQHIMETRNVATKQEAAVHACNVYHIRTGGNVSESSLLRMARRYARWKDTQPDVRVSRNTHAYGTQPESRDSVPRFDEPLRITVDRCIVVGDVHVPTTNWTFAARVGQLARHHDVKTLCIVGDLFNFDALSDYANIVPGISLAQEMQVARELINDWLRTFDRIYMTLGNHEHRLMRRTNAALGVQELASMITHDERFTLIEKSWMEVDSTGEVFRLTHQRNHSKLPLNTANKIAAIKHQHVITHHEHHTAIGIDASGKYAIVSNGGLHDSRMMAYVQLVDNTMPNMTNGFVYINDGTAHLLTPYDALTDWRMWIPPRDARTISFPEQRKEDAA